MTDDMTDMYVLDGKTPRKVDDLMEWAQAWGTMDRHVAKTTIGGALVSTVFLGIDHNHFDGPPLIFETMAFGWLVDDYQERCSTWEEAEAMHGRAVRLVKQQHSRIALAAGIAALAVGLLCWTLI